MITEAAIMGRAKQIFERENPGDLRWGEVGQPTPRIQILEGSNPKPIGVLTPPERHPYIERAFQELQQERVSDDAD